MDSIVIQAWVNDVRAALATSSTVALGCGTTSKTDRSHELSIRRACSPSMPSPSKRARTGEPYDHEPDPEQTPTRPRHVLSRDNGDDDVFVARDGASAVSASSFTAVIQSRPLFSASATAQQAPTDPSSPSRRSRSSSPSKRFQKRADLLNLIPPVRCTTEPDLGSALPDDAYELLRLLAPAEGKDKILPSSLCGHIRDFRINEHMWDSESDDVEVTLADHARLRAILDDSISSPNLSRSEAAWNMLVHVPILRFATSAFVFVDVEPITTANIIPAIRPRSKSTAGRDAALPHRPSAGVSIASSASTNSRETTPAQGVMIHKMVDLALVLQPDGELERIIDIFLDMQPRSSASINQTAYEPLRRRPSPVFIETKTSRASSDTANVQMGVWIAAWHERMRSIIALGKPQKVLTLPVVQVVGAAWYLILAVDGGSEIRLVDSEFKIGDTSTIIGIYQLRAALGGLAVWMRDVFKPWISDLLASAVENS